MPQISVNVDPETYEYKKKKGLNWRNLILEGIESSKIKAEFELLKKEHEELAKDCRKKGIKLNDYIQKYGVDENILYRRID